jgi:hypothetical protein
LLFPIIAKQANMPKDKKHETTKEKILMITLKMAVITYRIYATICELFWSVSEG